MAQLNTSSLIIRAEELAQFLTTHGDDCSPSIAKIIDMADSIGICERRLYALVLDIEIENRSLDDIEFEIDIVTSNPNYKFTSRKLISFINNKAQRDHNRRKYQLRHSRQHCIYCLEETRQQPMGSVVTFPCCLRTAHWTCHHPSMTCAGCGYMHDMSLADNFEFGEDHTTQALIRANHATTDVLFWQNSDFSFSSTAIFPEK